MTHRREFLKFLAASPLLTDFSVFAQEVEETIGERLTDPSEVINVFEMEAIAREKMPPAHFGYLSTGVDSDITLRANRAGFTRFQIKPRRLVDVSQTDTSVNILGTEASSPIFLCPVGSHGAYHSEAELGTARAAAAKGHHMILSTQASTPIEEVTEARGAPLWFQLYPTDRWEYTVAMLQRAEAAGCTAVCLTIDLPGGRNTETQQIFTRQDTRTCSSCHTGQAKPIFDGLNMRGVGLNNPAMTWDVIARMKDVTDMKVFIKGIEVAADSALAVQYGADGIVVSNHGGRATETDKGTIECLPEIVSAVNGRIPIIIDSGFRRGTDVYKALAMGASAVGIGRPYCWGLGAFGQAGVERVLDLLNRELLITMQGSGTPTINSIGPDYVNDVGYRVPRGILGRELL
ncbi:MAG: alpha-hydroxy-acid oxidizing protein [Pseudomonadales bacterium]|jgi:isopentenyl diphosphate isomerase/L-lactate dehydrogenase-like FMN-dependent dehydrogenase|nr:alpha-hydroxy-acid oxidizing enzyme [Gammaproteobacteria bacterium]MCH2345039.1 alpha-hydroxy-acid oxidizing protein [Pseudomonadales bacterium]HAC86909.1 alpha-hydroxy-acid oxidizing enzyme [Gammaproteobacteria bacterium]HAD72310.1 alpha-hydroxy-acid oxidizing enzyme [Gammaproteobacteria bacterium]|tara:strand:+ start:614 stop:1825 length:1212 start_codon:yes stop_codon:yes gene_type:complete